MYFAVQCEDRTPQVVLADEQGRSTYVAQPVQMVCKEMAQHAQVFFALEYAELGVKKDMVFSCQYAYVQTMPRI